MWQNNGFIAGGRTDVSAAMDQLELLIDYVRKQLESLGTEEVLRQPAPGKWSRQQVLGHLVDSAVNNLKRFTDVQFSVQPYKVISYKQDELVAVNNYQELPLTHLLDLWQSLNRQIIFVVKNIPADKLLYTVHPPYDEEPGSQTLAWLVCDYVVHMQHHIGQMALDH